jgi:hypothetical protein
MDQNSLTPASPLQLIYLWIVPSIRFIYIHDKFNEISERDFFALLSNGPALRLPS